MAIDNTLPELDNSNLWDRVYSILKRKIVHRHYSPDEKISIVDIAEQLKVSRTPVRDALNRLEMDGLVVTRSKVGTFITPIDADLVNSVMDTRLMIEMWTVDKIEHLPEEVIRASVSSLESYHRRAVTAALQAPETYHEHDLNRQFHLDFIALGGNSRNVLIYRDLMNYSLPATTPDQVLSGEIERATKQHARILDALRACAFDELRAAIRDHLDDSKRNVLEKIERNGGKI